MRATGTQVASAIVLCLMFGFVALSLFVWASEATTPTRSWGLFFAGLYVVALMAFAVFSILTQGARAGKSSGWSFRRRTGELVAWLLLTFIVLLTVFMVGLFAGTPLAMDLLLAANIALIGGWLLLLHKARRLPGADAPRR